MRNSEVLRRSFGLSLLPLQFAKALDWEADAASLAGKEVNLKIGAVHSTSSRTLKPVLDGTQKFLQPFPSGELSKKGVPKSSGPKAGQ